MSFAQLRRFVALISLVFAFVIAGLPFGAVGSMGLGARTAIAQERQPGLLELLFKGNRNKKKPSVQKVPSTKKKKTVRKKSTVRAKPSSKKRSVKRAASPPKAGAAAAVEKTDNARRVLVVGDFVADGMSQGLEKGFENVANVVVETRVNGSSGLVRDDFYNWPVEIKTIIEETKPSIVVVMLGSNDRQAMRVEGKTAKVRSESWDAEYKRRVDAFVQAVRDTNTPLMWVGSPPFKFRSMSADMLAFNEVYRQSAEAKSGIFVDIWDGFTDENGAFVLSGADVKGQLVRLRASDGINFTKAGKAKMAFYVERQLKQLLGDAASPLLTTLANETAPLLTLPPLETEADLQRTNPISMQDPDLDGGNVLLGDITKQAAQNNNPLQAKSVRQRLVEDGVAPPSQPGRAGDFAWPG